ncbi:MAG: ArsR family transcriptional regulator, partial [Nitrososphaerota archaeon]|nr:ArsR family transcriptional regulator [Nitrososphaerota archaeon]
MKQNNPDDILEGTTRRVFRFVYRQQNPVGIHDVQRGLGLSSPSVAHYHIGKLVKAGLLKEEGGGYVVDKVVFENMIRVRRAAIPLQTAYAVFLLSAFALLVTVFRPAPVSSTYVFAVVV